MFAHIVEIFAGIQAFAILFSLMIGRNRSRRQFHPSARLRARDASGWERWE